MLSDSKLWGWAKLHCAVLLRCLIYLVFPFHTQHRFDFLCLSRPLGTCEDEFTGVVQKQLCFSLETLGTTHQKPFANQTL